MRLEECLHETNHDSTSSPGAPEIGNGIDASSELTSFTSNGHHIAVSALSFDSLSVPSISRHREQQAMSHTSTPTPQPVSVSGYASPALSTSSTASTSKHHHVKAKPTNVFSNDGSFLQRFQHLKKVRYLSYSVGSSSFIVS